MARDNESEGAEDSAAASGPDPWPPRDSSPEQVNRLVQQEMHNLKALKRLSINSTLVSHGDPDLPGFDPDAEFDMDAGDAPAGFGRAASLHKQRSIRRERSLPTTRRERSLQGTPFMLDVPAPGSAADPKPVGDSAEPALDNIWVPAGVHPELAPNEWRTFVQDKLAEIRNSQEQQLNSRATRHQSRLSHEVADLEGYVDASAILDKRRRSSNAGAKRRSILEMSREFVGDEFAEPPLHRRPEHDQPDQPDPNDQIIDESLQAERIADAFPPPDLRPLGGATSLRRSTHRMRRPPARAAAGTTDAAHAQPAASPLTSEPPLPSESEAPKSAPAHARGARPDDRHKIHSPRRSGLRAGFRPPLSVSISAATAVAHTAEQPPSPSAATPSPSASTMLGYRRRRQESDRHARQRGVRDDGASQRKAGSPDSSREPQQRDLASGTAASSVFAPASASFAQSFATSPPSTPPSSSPSESDSDGEANAWTQDPHGGRDPVSAAGLSESADLHSSRDIQSTRDHLASAQPRDQPTRDLQASRDVQHSRGVDIVDPDASAAAAAAAATAAATTAAAAAATAAAATAAAAAAADPAGAFDASQAEPRTAKDPAGPAEKKPERSEKVERRWRWLDSSNSKDSDSAKEPKPTRQKEGLTLSGLFKKRDNKRDSKREHENGKSGDAALDAKQSASPEPELPSAPATPAADPASQHPVDSPTTESIADSADVRAPRRMRGHMRADSRISNRISKDSSEAHHPETVKSRGRRKTAAALERQERQQEHDQQQQQAAIPASSLGQQPEIKLPYDIPAHQISDRSYVMMYHRFPLHIERAIYRLSHMKLANPRRPLRQQVLLSNFMYAYLNLVNYGYQQQQLQQFYERQQQLQQYADQPSPGGLSHLSSDQLEQLKHIETRNYDESMYHSPDGANDDSSSSEEDEPEPDTAGDSGVRDQATYLFKNA